MMVNTNSIEFLVKIIHRKLKIEKIRRRRICSDVMPVKAKTLKCKKHQMQEKKGR